jgi:integrase
MIDNNLCKNVIYKNYGGLFMVTTPIKRKEDIELLKNYFLGAKEYRNYTMFVLGINTALRISDLLQLKWGDVWDFEKEVFYLHIYIREQKTSKMNCIAVNKSCSEALTILKEQCKVITSEEYVFFSGNNRNRHISRNRAYNIIKKAAVSTHIEGNISCHSLRKTFGYHAWKCGTPPALIMSIYNHSTIEITKRYLSIEQDDKDALFQRINL